MIVSIQYRAQNAFVSQRTSDKASKNGHPSPLSSVSSKIHWHLIHFPPTFPAMKFPLATLAFLISLSFTACKDNSPSTNASNSNGPKSCLSRYHSQIADILTKERLLSSFDPGTAELKQEVHTGKLILGISWTWPSDRIREMNIAGQTISVPIDNEVSVSQFKLLDQEKFGPKDSKSYVEANYRSISAEEMATITANMDAQLQKRVEKGEITAEQAKLAGGMGSGLMGKERVVETIDGVGDACRWTATDKTLAVGHRNVFFSLLVNVSSDANLNRDKAIALAKAILAECD